MKSIVNKKNIFPIVLVLCCVITSVAAQKDSYSESSPYQPRKDPWPSRHDSKGGKKNRKKGEVLATEPATLVADNLQTVALPISVFDGKGKFYKGLTKANFTLFIDDREVPITSLESRDDPVKVILLLDASASSQTHIDAVKQTSKALVESMPPDASFLVIQFDMSMKVLSNLTNNRPEILKAIDKVKAGDGTSLYSAIKILFQKITPQIPGRKLLIMFTDGVDTTSQNSSFSESLVEAEKDAASAYPIYVDTLSDIGKFQGSISPMQMSPLGIASRQRGRIDPEQQYDTGKRYLSDLAELSGGRLINADELLSIPTKIGDELKLQYFATFTLPMPSGSPRHSIRVRVNRPNLLVRARGSYLDAGN